MCHLVLAVKFRPDLLISMHKVINFSGQLFILSADYFDVGSHGVNLDLELVVGLTECRIRIFCIFCFSFQLHQFVLSSSDLELSILYFADKLDVLVAFLISASL
jgi:hypothetical protein